MCTAAPDGPVPSENLARPRWHKIYFWLAAFDVLTVTLGLLLTHRIMSIYRESVDRNRGWAELLRGSAELGRSAVEVNEPGNHVFKTGDLLQARATMEMARTRFDRACALLEEKLTRVASRVELPFLRGQVTAVTRAMEDMTARALQILDHLRHDRKKEAGEAMAEMDAEYGKINHALTDFQIKVGNIQEEHFGEHTEDAARYERF